jgi:hypothetical protein
MKYYLKMTRTLIFPFNSTKFYLLKKKMVKKKEKGG